jgi:hypothetical protein
MDTQTRRTTREDYDADDDDLYQTRRPTSTRRYTTSQQQAIVRQRPRDVVRYTEVNAPRRRVNTNPTPRTEEVHHRCAHPLVYIGVGGVGVLLLFWVALSIMAWWRVYQDDQHYGRPRTYQIDAAVGHNQDSPAKPSHFVAINLHRHIIIIEIAAGDQSKTVSYDGPSLMGDNQDLTPVTLSFEDDNGDGKIDMIVHLNASNSIWLNDGHQFKLSGRSQ